MCTAQMFVISWCVYNYRVIMGLYKWIFGDSQHVTVFGQMTLYGLFRRLCDPQKPQNQPVCPGWVWYPVPISFGCWYSLAVIKYPCSAHLGNVLFMCFSNQSIYLAHSTMWQHYLYPITHRPWMLKPISDGVKCHFLSPTFTLFIVYKRSSSNFLCVC